MIKSLFAQFQQHSQDFLRLLGEKARYAKHNRTAEDELGVMEFFWDGCEEIMKKYEAALMEEQMGAAYARCFQKILESELNFVYSRMAKSESAEVKRILAEALGRTKRVTKEEMQTETFLKFKDGQTQNP